MLDSETWFLLIKRDPTGRAAHALELVRKYRGSVRSQHKLIFERWGARDFHSDLLHTHYLLIGIDRTQDGLELASAALGGTLSDFLPNVDLSDYRDARNHFEHLEDRLFGTKRNAPQSITEGGATRTVHFGLKANPPRFEWGSRQIDISEQFVSMYENYVEAAEALIVEKPAE